MKNECEICFLRLSSLLLVAMSVLIVYSRDQKAAHIKKERGKPMKAIRLVERSSNRGVDRIVFAVENRPIGTPSDIERRFHRVLEAAGFARTTIVFQDNPRAYRLVVTTRISYTDQQLEVALAAAL